MHETLEVANSRFKTTVHYLTGRLNEEIREGILHDADIIVVDKNLPVGIQNIFVKSVKLERIIYISGGEDAKTLRSVVNLLDVIEERGLITCSKILAIGGGTIQDLVGTACGLLKRGTRWDFVPTTVLAQCDSCIGSKTSINSKNSKNSYGVFWAPQQIFIDEDLIRTQEVADIMSGVGDALHYLFTDICRYRKEVEKCIEVLAAIRIDKAEVLGIKGLAKTCHLIKKEFVEVDEFDDSVRKNLNLGHTFGHAIESLSNLSVPHGVAVLHGILIAYNYSLEKGFIKDDPLFYQLAECLDETEAFSRERIMEIIYTDLERYIDLLGRDKKSVKDDIGCILFTEGYRLNKIAVHKAVMKDFFQDSRVRGRLVGK